MAVLISVSSVVVSAAIPSIVGTDSFSRVIPLAMFIGGVFNDMTVPLFGKMTIRVARVFVISFILWLMLRRVHKISGMIAGMSLSVDLADAYSQ